MVNNTRKIIKYWQKQLEIKDWKIKTNRISRFQACDNNQIGVEFVGISRDDKKTATIYHTRKLKRKTLYMNYFIFVTLSGLRLK